MKSRKLDRSFLSAFVGIAIVIISSVMFTSCVEEKQLDDLVQDTNQEEGVQEPVVALPGLPEDVAGYEKWLKLNAEPIPLTEGFDPHKGTKNVYVNQKRETIAPDGEQQFPYPDGSIVVKEAYPTNQDYIWLIAIMRKKAGTDPDHNDWKFVEYTRSGPDAEFKLAFQDGTCWGCHARVEDMDYVFTELD